MLQLLSCEREEAVKKDKILKDLSSLVNIQQSKYEGNISNISSLIDSLLENVNLSSDILFILETMKSILSSNYYNPSVAKLIEDLETVDSETEKWLVKQLGIQNNTSNQLEYFKLPSHSDNELVPKLYSMFEYFDLISTFHINPDKLNNFLISIQNGYLPNPYHSFRHAFDVTQCLFYFLVTGRAAEYLTKLEIFSLLVSATGHDLRHPGFTNSFLIATESPIAIQFNDNSPLENLHCLSTWNLLTNPSINIIEGLSTNERLTFRKILKNVILDSDSENTVDLITKFNMISSKFDKNDSSHRETLCSYLIKCADISNPVRTFSCSRYWATMIVEEYHNQGDKEKELNIPLSPFMDRESNLSLDTMQTGFIDFVVRPVYQPLYDFLPNIIECITNLNVNYLNWKEFGELKG